MDFRHINSTGFTLLELISTLAIGSILVAAAIPSYQSLHERSRMAASVNMFMSHLYQARSEAIKRERYVTLCPSSNGSDCIADYTQWAKGYIVFIDSNKDKERDAGEQVLSFYEGEDDKLIIHSSSNFRKVVTYYPTGRAWNFNTTIRICSKLSDDYNRAVIIASTGRPRLSKVMPDGRKVVCE